MPVLSFQNLPVLVMCVKEIQSKDLNVNTRNPEY